MDRRQPAIDVRAYRELFVPFVLLSAVALLVRLYAARAIGFGDSEALYASYALFPQPAYLDHPALIGRLARLLGQGFAPSPVVVHTFTAFAATLAPWFMLAAGRVLRLDLARTAGAAIAVAVAPEIAVGLFGMTPDLVLYFAWVVAVACFGRALSLRPASTNAALCFVAAGLALGVACAAKVSGLTLALAFAVTLTAKKARPHARTLWPYATLALAAVIFAPVVVYEARTGWPMLRHRLVDTQVGAGASLRNLAAVFFGQAAYVSPLLFVLGLGLARELFLTRREDVLRSLLAASLFVPLVALGALCLWSRVAEPHWLAPVWLALPLYYAHRSSPAGLRGARVGVYVGLVASALVYAWSLVPSLPGLVPGTLYDAKLDIANELYGWPQVTRDVARTVAAARVPLGEPEDVVVVGPVWTVCAQLRAALPRDIAVGCAGTDVADFATWNPSASWGRAEIIVFVSDNRAPQDHARLFPDRVLVESHTQSIVRGGRVARLFTIQVLARRAAG